MGREGPGGPGTWRGSTPHWAGKVQRGLCVHMYEFPSVSVKHTSVKQGPVTLCRVVLVKPIYLIGGFQLFTFYDLGYSGPCGVKQSTKSINLEAVWKELS